MFFQQLISTQQVVRLLICFICDYLFHFHIHFITYYNHSALDIDRMIISNKIAHDLEDIQQ